MNTTNLESIFDSRKDFYGKAKKEEKKEVIALYSYDTKVATLNTKTNTLNLLEYSTCSQTTLRHVREFLLQNNITNNNIMINGKLLNSLSKANLELLVDRKIKINQDNIIKN